MKKITTPSELRRYILALASVLYIDGYIEESKLLEEAARLPCTTGGEWLSELAIACMKVKNDSKLPGHSEQRIADLICLVTSSNPYSE